MIRKKNWFPAVKSTQVMGRFIDVEVVDIAASRAKNDGHNVYKRVPALQSRVAGSDDISVQAVKPYNEQDLRARFPGAWEHYLAKKAAKAAPVEHDDEDDDEGDDDFVPAIDGTPLHTADFIPRDKQTWFSEQGISTLEQIRDLSDTAVQNLGRGTQTYRKKAREFLART